MDMFTAEKIRDLRLKLRLSLAQFAGELGVGEAAVRRWELGERHPRFQTLVRLNELSDKLNGNGHGKKKR